MKYLIFTTCFILIGCDTRHPEKISHLSTFPENHCATVDSLIKSISNDTTALKNYLSLSVATGDKYAEINVYEKLGDYYLHNYLYQRAIDYHKLYAEKAQLSRDSLHIIRALNKLAFDFAQGREYNESAKYYFKALIQANKFGIETQEQKEIANTLNGLGEIYFLVNQPDEAMNYFRKALQSDKQNQDSKTLATTLQHIGTVYEYERQYDSAYVYYQKSLEYHIKSNSVSGLNNCFWHIGNLYMTKGDYENALVYFESAYNSLLSTSDRLNWINVTLSLGELNTKRGNYFKAETYLEDARKISNKLNLSDCLGKAYLLLSELHKIQGKTALALEEHALSDEITKAFIKEKKIHQIMMHRLYYEKEVNKKEMSALTGILQKREEKTEKTLLLTFLIIVILVLIILILFQNIWFKRQKRLNSLQLEKMKSTYFTKISEEFKISASIIIGLVERLTKNLQNKNNDYAIEMNMLSRQSENLFLLIN